MLDAIIFFPISLTTFFICRGYTRGKSIRCVARDETNRKRKLKKTKKKWNRKRRYSCSGERSRACDQNTTYIHDKSLFTRDYSINSFRGFRVFSTESFARTTKYSWDITLTTWSGRSDDRLFSAWGTFEMVLEQWNLAIYIRLAVTDRHKIAVISSYTAQ